MEEQNAELYLFDIEGTTTPIEFVHKVLFPYSVQNFITFFSETSAETGFAEELILASKNEKEYTEEVSNSPESLAKFCNYLVSKDRKLGILKEIQGRIWKKGYESGELKSTIFSDVPPFLERIRKSGKRAAVYSSGSVEAQILIYKYCEAGDLTVYFENYFDTAVGGKKEASSYTKISEKLSLPPSSIVFFTDIKEEADAATKAGVRSILLSRPGNHPQAEHKYQVIENFTRILA
ncbi:acireductone synthase [Leptospira hartskeerlii]|uniref:Enolase-phosphatase E1 n=1 Tax=Leptospira hartskeerlii TaxID=2023177 RepID=A0A2M9XC88_9LEPT|nr:acireductone synthase [Leptospira hartskeerlii]PJZ25315.1 acireductone synthase [Leptospira hartskeerlii]PJZ32705.1 acireductone synthase [Leptospira hartskeerlii]